MKLKEFRLKKGLTQEQMAKLVGISKSMYEKLEYNQARPSLETIEKFKATRLSDIIYRLRNRGFKIETIDIPFVDNYGTKSSYGKYVLIEG